MTRLRALAPLAFAAFAAAPPAPVATPGPAPSPAGEVSRIAGIEAGLRPPVVVEGDRLWTISDRMAHYKVPGVSVAVIQDFRIAWAKGYGLADAALGQRVTDQTLFQAGSISKPVAAMVALTLVEEGRLTLDGDINAVLRGWKVPENDLTRTGRVTLAGLLSHTAGVTVHGFAGYASDTPVPTLREVLDGEPPANSPAIRVDLRPGSQFRYSGGGYTIAQQAMIDVSGRPFPALAAQTVLEPLGMTRASFEQPLDTARLRLAAAGYLADGSPVPGKRHVYPEMAAAGLWATASDLARFAIGLQDALRGKPAPISRALAERMITPVLGDYGLGLTVQSRRGQVYFGHDGADEGFQALLLAHAGRGYGAAIMTNSDAGLRLAPEILRAIAAAYGWEGMDLDPVRLAAVDPARLAGLAGRYRLDSDALLAVAVSPDGKGLTATLTFGGTFDLLPVSDGVFVRREDEQKYVFGPGAGGRGELRIEGGRETLTAPRIGADERLPGEQLEAGKIPEALAAYRRLFARAPSDPAVAEPRLNDLGYRLLSRGDRAQAIALFQLNTELYPGSSNTFDSLGEAYMVNGDREKAVAAYRKALVLIPKDPRTSAARKDAQRAHAMAKLRELAALAP